MRAKIELTKEQVEDIITEYMKDKYKIVGKAKIEVGMEYEDRPCGSKYPKFKKAVVDIEI